MYRIFIQYTRAWPKFHNTTPADRAFARVSPYKYMETHTLTHSLTVLLVACVSRVLRNCLCVCVCVRHITVDDGLWCDAVYHVHTHTRTHSQALTHVRRGASHRCGLTELFKSKPNSAPIRTRTKLTNILRGFLD